MLLVLLRVALGLAFDGLLGLMVAVVVIVQVLGLPVQVVRGGPFASVSPCGCLGSRRVCSSSHLRIPNDLAEAVAWGSEAGRGCSRCGVVVVCGRPGVLFC